MDTNNTDIFEDLLPADLEHAVHLFLHIAEVCALQRVSTSWRARIRRAVRHDFQWDLTYRGEWDFLTPRGERDFGERDLTPCGASVDGTPSEWLARVADAEIRARSLNVVSVRSSFSFY